MGTYAHQLKGDYHARQVLQQQVTRFPGIPHSLVTEPAPVEEIVPLLPALTDGAELAPLTTSGPIYEPVPLADVPAIEAVPTVDIPPEAPQWLGYAVRLLQAGWHVRDVAKEIGYDQTRMWRVFKNPRARRSQRYPAGSLLRSCSVSARSWLLGSRPRREFANVKDSSLSRKIGHPLSHACDR